MGARRIVSLVSGALMAGAALCVLAAAGGVGVAERREQVRAIAKPLCGECHQSTRATAKPKALAVFDLDATENWAEPLDTRRLQAFFQRITGKVDKPTRSRVRAFVDGEIALRKP